MVPPLFASRLYRPYRHARLTTRANGRIPSAAGDSARNRSPHQLAGHFARARIQGKLAAHGSPSLMARSRLLFLVIAVIQSLSHQPRQYMPDRLVWQQVGWRLKPRLEDPHGCAGVHPRSLPAQAPAIQPLQRHQSAMRLRQHTLRLGIRNHWANGRLRGRASVQPAW